MTPAQLRHRVIAIVKRLEMRNPPFPIHPPRVTVTNGAIVIVVAIEVRDRDAGDRRTLYHTAGIDVGTLSFLESRGRLDAHVLMIYEGLLERIFEHEFAEAFHRDGVRARDPHVAVGERLREAPDAPRISAIRLDGPIRNRRILTLTDGRRALVP